MYDSFEKKPFLKPQGHYAVVGLGASGLSAALYLYHLGYQVSVTDGKRPALAKALPDDVVCYFDGLNQDLLGQVDGIVISPGVNPLHFAIVFAKQQGIPVVSDVQLFVDECHQRAVPIVAITGSNAKSTVTTLVAKMVADAGMAVGVGGNLGTPALELLKAPLEVAVLELSSFQLEHITQLQAAAATILNLSPDHLDRHGDMTNYLQAKLAIFEGVQTACLWADDVPLYQACVNQLTKCGVLSRPFCVSAHAPTREQDFGIVRQADGLFLAQGKTLLLKADKLPIKGTHNLVNALFALSLGVAIGLPMHTMLDTLVGFHGLPHRCQFVKTVHGKDYFNDSKGTNVGATIAALEGLGEVYGTRSLVLILGGQAKGQSFEALIPLIEHYVHTVLTIGVDADKIMQDLAQITTPMIVCQNLQNAVTVADTLKAKAVLLSPACASLDQFAGFEQRGACFIEWVEQLA